MNVETSVRSNPNVACDAIVSPAGNEIIYVAPDDVVLDGFVDSGRFLRKPASPERHIGARRDGEGWGCVVFTP